MATTFPISLPYSFATATSPIPLGNLDSDLDTLKTALNDVSSGTGALSAPKLGNASATTLATSGAITATSSIKSSNATAGIGYATGAGAGVTQVAITGYLYSYTTPVTINSITGRILTSSTFSGAIVSFARRFQVFNSTVSIGDTIITNVSSGITPTVTTYTPLPSVSSNGIYYTSEAFAISTGSFWVNICLVQTNLPIGFTDSPSLNFAVIKAVSS
jgi:hypothetical protein